ncbi:ABC transporter permease [Kocuria rhizophila]|uniref:Putative ABC transporter permease protein n=1 Tax=Kocuria rhizophila (strain ATCC 9341 / DSM 348 / NBRC 103217 / DC2201) TaxID=378753 RepID=B2GIZ1_KOCRD|nr:ABC transporter permease [Kocuria rhizophila]ASE11568.1 ABC transporter permease [Kocuria rhizophila]MDV5998027.1 ABC transporter permease [Kocuria rhizophila]BAG28382.1 putative ABC transporter permease protein [Kocuria rhizophila DC2201]VEH73998.1 Glycine betaine/L-proline transport system permease protein proW [Kocuria rhizophila]
MSLFTEAAQFLTDPANWTGATGIPQRLLEHAGYSALTMAIALVIAVPLGLWVGHTGRGGGAVVGLAGALRSLPTLGLLTLFTLLMGLGLMPPILALVLLAVPPILSGTYSGIAAVSPSLVDAARAMGMTESQTLFRVEVPVALPVILGGIRNAALQVLATVTIVAYINLGGLGRYLIDGLAVRDYSRMLASVVLVAVLALAADAVLALTQRLVTSPGLRLTGDRP